MVQKVKRLGFHEYSFECFSKESGARGTFLLLQLPYFMMFLSVRSLRDDPYLERVVDAVKALERAIVMDTGMDGEIMKRKGRFSKLQS